MMKFEIKTTSREIIIDFVASNLAWNAGEFEPTQTLHDSFSWGYFHINFFLISWLPFPQKQMVQRVRSKVLVSGHWGNVGHMLRDLHGQPTYCRLKSPAFLRMCLIFAYLGSIAADLSLNN